MDLVKALSSQYMKAELPEMRVGDTVRVHVRIKEGSRERIQVFEGVIIRAKRGEETLWDIAKVCGSTVSAIQRLNKLEREPEDNRLLLIPVI